MRVLVTGGAGYIGSHTAKALARAGFEPVVLDHLSTGHEKNARWGPLAGRESLAVNLGTGRGSSVREVVAAVERASGKKVPAREAPRRAGDPPLLVAASHRAKSLWGWQPVHSDLTTIVPTAWSWHARKLEQDSVVATSAER